MLRQLTVISTASLLLVACNNTVPRGFVQRDWTLTMRELGIVPVFPAREDVMVGDVYAYGYDPNDLAIDKILETPWKKLTDDQKSRRLAIGMSSRFARLDLNDDILKEYQGTPSFPQTSADYNNILGNPALAAAAEKVKAATGELESHREKITDGKEALAKASDAVLAAARKHEDAAKALADAEAALTAAKALPVDTSAEKARLAEARQRKRTADDNVVLASHAVENAANAPQTERDAAAAALVAARREQAAAEVAVTRANEDLTASSTRKVDTSAEEKAVADARTARDAAASALLAANRERDDKAGALTRITEVETPLIAAAQAELKKAEEIKQAIAIAGVKLLYAQPKDTKADVFTAEKLKSDLEMQNSRVNRLRLVAFPEFATVSVSQGDLTALIPIDAMALGLNISSNNVKKVSVKIPAAESYALSQHTLLKHLFTDDRLSELKPCAAGIFKWAMHSTAPSTSVEERNFVYARVVTEVYYARAMDIGIFASDTFGARIGYQPPVESGPAPAAPAAPGASPLDSGATMLADIQRRIAETPSLPGGTIQIVSQTETSVGLRRVFDRPVAVGVRSLIVKFRRCDGSVVQVIGADSGPTPMSLKE